MERLLAAASLTACASPSPSDADAAGAAPNAEPLVEPLVEPFAEPLAELDAQGGARYVGAFEPDTVEETDRGVAARSRAVGDEGPACIRGAPCRSSWRAGDGDGQVHRRHRGLANLSAALDAAHARSPARLHAFIAEGDLHAAVPGHMVDDDPAWGPHVAPEPR